MDTYSNIKKTLQEICHKNTETFHIARVLNVAGEKCDVMINGTLKIEGVRQLASHSATF